MEFALLDQRGVCVNLTHGTVCRTKVAPPSSAETPTEIRLILGDSLRDFRSQAFHIRKVLVLFFTSRVHA